MNTAIVNIDVPELESGIRFYTAAIALRLSRRLGSGFAEHLGAGVPIYLIAAPDTTQSRRRLD